LPRLPIIGISTNAVAATRPPKIVMGKYKDLAKINTNLIWVVKIKIHMFAKKKVEFCE
jgi:hypothetical protein